MKRQLAIFYLSTFLFNYFYSISESKVLSIQGRPLVAGDTFTPQEMLPIAKKLLKKVCCINQATVNKWNNSSMDDPGNGKGFVSSTRNPQALSDKLFEAFFVSDKRIVTLTDYDITSIDALQALALSGEDFEPLEETSTQAGNTKFLRGQFVEVRGEPKKSQYNLVTKQTSLTTNKADRRGIRLAQKLGKTRNLIVSKRRNNSKKRKENEKHCQFTNLACKASTKSKARRKSRTCRWNYVCDDVADLDSCKLKANCSQQSMSLKTDGIAMPHKSDKHTLAIIQFRKMLGISAVDEEVEKILESRHLHLRPENTDALNKVETLSERFDNIIVLERLESTTPLISQKEKVNK